MKKLFTLFFLTSFPFTAAYAGHLGPLVFGEERVEEITFCTSEAAAVFILQQDEESANAGESIQEYATRVERMFSDCGMDIIAYTPQKVVYQGLGRQYLKGRITQAPASVVEAGSKEKVLYVITFDPVPSPESE